MKVFRIIASWLYSIGVYIRNMLYHYGLLRTTEVDIPTICVGNLAVGGTGKTPHTEYLIRLLHNDYKVAVLSRGYKRKSKGIVLVTPSEVFHTVTLPPVGGMKGGLADTIGDEPTQIHMHFPDVPICVSGDRVAGVRYIQKHCPDVQVIILDDAYQHRAITCGYYVLLTAENNLYVNDHIMPWGRLREHAYRSHRADMVVVTKCPAKMQPIDRRNIIHSLNLASFQHLAFSWMRYGALRRLEGEKVRKLEGEKAHPALRTPNAERRTPNAEHRTPNAERPLQGDGGLWFFRPLVLAGIAHPETMLDEVRSRYPQAQLVAFPDHHRFTKRDWKRVTRIYEKHHCDAIITTEKDAVRLLLQDEYIRRWGDKTYVLPIEIDFNEFTDIFNQNIIRYVEENTRNR